MKFKTQQHFGLNTRVFPCFHNSLCTKQLRIHTLFLSLNKGEKAMISFTALHDKPAQQTSYHANKYAAKPKAILPKLVNVYVEFH